jgi:hypothetical protein
MDQPFFLIGFQRSGTTLLRVMLDSHPEVAVPLDTVGLWSRYSGRLAQYNHLASRADRRRLVADLLEEERIRLWEVALDPDRVLALSETGETGETTAAAGPDGRYAGVVAAFYQAYAEARGKRRWGDKDPGNMTRLPQLDAWFPGCRFVHIVRDGRDACLSQLRQTFGHQDPLRCAEDWREQVFWVRTIGRLLGPGRYHELRYEDLLAEPDQQLRALCRFLGLDYAAADMLAYPERRDQAVPEGKRHLWPLLDQPPQQSNAGKWRREMSPALRVCFEKRAGAVLAELGYETLQRPSGAYLEEARHALSGALRSAARRLRPRPRRSSRAEAKPLIEKTLW